MKIWLKLIIAGIVVCLAGIVMFDDYGFTSNFGAIGFLAASIGGAMVMIGLLTGLKRGYRRMMNE